MVSERELLRWVASFLALRDLEIANFDADFADGVKLCQFIQIITYKPLMFHMQPRTMFHKLENFEAALSKMKREGIVTYLNASQVMNNRDLLIGFLWNVCVRYAILL